MPDAKPAIKYVVISDTHFGAATSLLTRVRLSTNRPHPVQPTPVLERLVACLRTLIPDGPLESKPTLILNGDIFELALSEMNLAGMAFLRFAELVFPKDGEPLFSRIIFLPGNHDHHLWEMARETQYLDHMSKPRWRRYPDPPHHATTLFLDDTKLAEIPPAQFLVKLLRHIPRFDGVDADIRTFYPNLGLLSDDGKKCLIVHHGHFVEPVYYLMSTLRTMLFPKRRKKGSYPPHVWDVEAENFAWIDFVWSTLGRSGKVGPDVGLVYELMHSDQGRAFLVRNLSNGFADAFGPRWLPAKARAMLWKLTLDIASERAAGQVESKKAGSVPLNPEAEECLKFYLEGPLHSQMCVSRRPGQSQVPADQEMPDDVTFLFGHTHKPFQTRRAYDRDKYKSPVMLHNIGGWIVEMPAPVKTFGGAIVFADAGLNTAQVEFYRESKDGAEPASVVTGPAGPNPLVAHLEGLMNANLPAWDAFTTAVEADLPDRRRILKAQQTPPAR